MKALKIIAFILVIVGGLNWGLVGLFNFDLVAAIFGAMSSVSVCSGWFVCSLYCSHIKESFEIV